MIKKYLLTVLACIAVWWSAGASAGQACEQTVPTDAKVVRGIEMAMKTLATLDASGADVVIIARAGQDLSKYGQHFTHAGFAYRDGNSWTIVHLLNECDSAVSHLYEQGMGQFFLDDPFRFEAGIAIPTPELQQKLRAVLTDPQRVRTQHNPHYNMVSYAWSTRYQQSNQWLLETLAMAAEPRIGNREQAQAWLKFKAYQPTVLTIGPLTRLGGRMFKANIAFDDHPNEKRFSDRIETIGADSIFAFLAQTGLQVQYIAVSL